MTMVLDGIKVVDVSQVAAVPMASRILADFGADVIHVENPEIGDIFRHVLAGLQTGIKSEFNYIWENYNRNKRSMTLDLTKPKGQEILRKMISTADVFTTNLRPMELKRFNLEYESLKNQNPRLIGAYLTGWGPKGPEKDNPAYDHTAYWARSGIPHKLRSVTPALQQAGTHLPAFLPSFGDHASGLSLVTGVMTALYNRERTGEGMEVGVSLFQTGVFQLAFDLAGSLATGEDCVTFNPELDSPNPLMAQYETKDDRWLLFSCLNMVRYLPKVCIAIGRVDLLSDPRLENLETIPEFVPELKKIIKAAVKTKTLKEWIPILNDAGVSYSPVQTHQEVINDPQARANDFFVAYDHPDHGRVEGVANHIKLNNQPDHVRMPAPEFGQHTEEVLLENGYTWEDIADFQDKGVIA